MAYEDNYKYCPDPSHPRTCTGNGCIDPNAAADPAQSAPSAEAKYRKQLDEMVEEVCAGYPMLNQKLRASMKFTQFGELIEENEILIGQLKAAETRAETAESALRQKEFDALIPLACQMAVMAHADQLDHCGKSAVFHVFHIGFSMSSTTDMIVGLLHDSVEDANASLESIRSIFGNAVAEAVDAITHPKHEPYADYLKRVMQNPIAHRVKIVDATHNLSRTDAIQDEALRERLRKKFTNALSVLTVAAQTPAQGNK